MLVSLLLLSISFLATAMPVEDKPAIQTSPRAVIAQREAEPADKLLSAMVNLDLLTTLKVDKPAGRCAVVVGVSPDVSDSFAYAFYFDSDGQRSLAWLIPPRGATSQIRIFEEPTWKMALFLEEFKITGPFAGEENEDKKWERAPLALYQNDWIHMTLVGGTWDC